MKIWLEKIGTDTSFIEVDMSDGTEKITKLVIDDDMFYSHLKLVYRDVTRKLIDTFTLVVEDVLDELLEFARKEDTTVVISTSTIMDKMKYKLS